MSDRDIVPRMRLWAEGLQNQKDVVLAVAITEAADEIERLRSERDEARREVCYLKSWNFDRAIKPEDYARLRKWACYEQAVRRSEQNEAEVPGLRRALEAELRKAMYESEG